MLIRFLKDGETYPWPLLLDADPNRELVTSYLAKSQVLVAEEANKVIGVLVYEKQARQWEILNVAVAADFQNQGIGGRLLEAAFAAMATEGSHQEVMIKTGDITSSALHLYLKKGFKQVALVQDYFIKHYPDPIYEDGVLLRNQVILVKALV